MRTLLQDELPAQAYGRLLLSPGAKPPLAVTPRGRQVCSCFDVREKEIDAALEDIDGPPEQRLQRVQDQLRCGTHCGSCLPELKRIVRLRPQVTRV